VYGGVGDRASDVYLTRLVGCEGAADDEPKQLVVWVREGRRREGIGDLFNVGLFVSHQSTYLHLRSDNMRNILTGDGKLAVAARKVILSGHLSCRACSH
jgi:hypothetical protein